MGILNLTPDSFYDGGAYADEKSILEQVEKMLVEGATFIDLGAYSSRPGADSVSLEEELRRLVPIVGLLIREFPEVMLSVDTFRSQAARRAIEAGAAMINDISAGKLDPHMLSTVAQYKVPYVMMHMKGTPQTMQQRTDYDDLVQEVLYYFSERIAAARAQGLHDIVIDPGFGFAKTLEQNYELLGKLERFRMLDLPLLAGLSRKSMIYKVLDTTPQNALNGTTALHMLALERGTSILRVHDVKEAMECIKLAEQLE